MNDKIKIMSIMAHQDDFEFNAGGLFALLRKRYGNKLKLKILTTTRGASGHHEMSLDDTFSRRDAEARKSAAIIEAEYECLKCLDGSHVHAQFLIDRNTLGGLWNSIRAFEPDFIFCPPIINDPLAGIHIDHYNTACAVRMAISQLVVPNAYPTVFGKRKERVKTPVIVNVDDPYAGGSDYDIAVDIRETYEKKVQMSLCHESQIFEWLPWTGGEAPLSEDEFIEKFRLRHRNLNERYGFDDLSPREYFKITHWGASAAEEELKKIFD
jgi:LmbE family N-acetylglucosaminyl deacetylase